MITRKTGRMLIAIERNAHFIASGALEEDVKENRKINARQSRKGFRMFEVRLAIRFLVSVCFCIE